jgi:hypothetical protein
MIPVINVMRKLLLCYGSTLITGHPMEKKLKMRLLISSADHICWMLDTGYWTSIIKHLTFDQQIRLWWSELVNRKFTTVG